MSFSEFPYSCKVTRKIEVETGTYPNKTTTTTIKTLYNGVCDIQLNDGIDGALPQKSNYFMKTP